MSYRVPNREFTPEVEYGVFWKNRNEYGLYTIFVGDSKTYYSLYRSDATFTGKTMLGLATRMA